MRVRPMTIAYIGVAVVIALVWYRYNFVMQPPQEVACTMEAKLCPDGSSVGRTGPNCAFAACPASTSTDPTIPAGWKSTSTASGVDFSYPEKLPALYINAVDWPPAVQIVDGPFACNAAGSETARAGRTEPVIVNSHTYCRTAESEGAAGSIYVNYAYASPILSGSQQGKIALLTFSVRMVQCGNYDDPQRSACEAERKSFNIDSIVDQIVQTFTQR